MIGTGLIILSSCDLKFGFSARLCLTDNRDWCFGSKAAVIEISQKLWPVKDVWKPGVKDLVASSVWNIDCKIQNLSSTIPGSHKTN